MLATMIHFAVLRQQPGGNTMAKSKRGHRAGGKFAGSHTTVIGEAGPVLDEAVADPAVTKIVNSIIESSSKGAGSPLRVKCIPLRDGICGFEVVVAKGGVTQRFYVYVSEKRFLRTLQEKLESFTDKKAGKRGKASRNNRNPPRATDMEW